MVVNGDRTNMIPAGAVTTFNGATNGTPTSATLTNLAGASIAKDFAPNPVATGLGSWSILTITIRTTATVSITGIGLVDNLPAGLQVAGGAAPAPTNSCGGTFSAPVGATTVQLVGGSLPIGFDNCFLTVPVTGANPGIYTNTIPANSLINDQGVSNRFPATAQLTLTGYSLGNRVWFDTNNDGLLNGAEVGVSGVRVELYRDDGTTPGVYDSGDTYLNFENTDGSGHYRFDNLGGGDYVVTIPSVNFNTPGAPLAGYLSSGTSIDGAGTAVDSIGPDPYNDVDSDDNGVTTFTGNAVNYVSAQTVTLGPGGTEPINDDDPTPNPGAGEAVNNQSNRTVDFGFYRLELGNQIFQDLDENGNWDGPGTDAVFPGTRVQLFASNGTTEINVGPDGILGTADDTPGGMTTGGSGTYLFSGMPAGSYVVRVLPTGYPGTIDTYDAADNGNPNINTDDNDNGIGEGPGTTSSDIVTLTPGSTGAQGNNTVTNTFGITYDPTVDFGYVTSLGKFLIGGAATHTSDPQVAIGEIVTYEAVLKIPAGATFNNVRLVDTPQAGLAFVDCIFVEMPAGVDSDSVEYGTGNIACNGFDGTTGGSNPLITSSGGQITFNFGTITSSSGSLQEVLVRYSLIVLDILANQDGGTLTNSVTWTWDGGGPRNTIAPIVEIVEPELTIDKNASPTSASVGDTITFTIDLSNPAPPSTADAFDVIVTDQIPSGLTFQLASQGYSGTAALTSFDFDGVDTLTWTWDVFGLNETASLTFNATYNGPPPVVNVTNAEWTSLEIDPASPGPPPVPVQRSPYNVAATERWYDPAAPAGVNSYGASASVTIDSLISDRIPDTGFAPGKVTELPAQPSNYVYSELGDLWLEIPSQGIKTTITGISQLGNTWDVQWLWDQVGYLQGTAFPTWAGNSALTAHVYLPDGTPGPFVDLHKLLSGDKVIVHAYGQRYIYEVRSNRKVSPRANIFKHEEFPWLTLITCQGYNEASDSYRYRIVVRAVQVRIEADQ